MPKLAQCLVQAQAAGVARVDAQILLLHALGREGHERAWLVTHDTDALNPEQRAAWHVALQRRLAGEPVAYITGKKEFYGLSLAVDARVLDPRPDTETLVEWALSVLYSHQQLSPDSQQPLRVLDMGTGSGAIALALQQAWPQAQVWALDASEEALTVARSNAQELKLPVQFLRSDWYAQLHGEFDLLVSNPPYIPQADPHLQALQHEPLSALVSGPDGLEAIRRIVSGAQAHLSHKGWLLIEHGFDQAPAVQDLLRQAGFIHVQSRSDLAGHERCSGGQKPSQ